MHVKLTGENIPQESVFEGKQFRKTMLSVFLNDIQNIEEGSRDRNKNVLVQGRGPLGDWYLLMYTV